MNPAAIRCAVLAIALAAVASTAPAAEPVVPHEYVSEALAHVEPTPVDEKDAEMAAAGYTGFWMPVVLVYDRDGALRQAYNGPLDAFLAEPLAVGRLAAPLADGLRTLEQRVKASGADADTAAFALAEDQEYLILLLSPHAMKSACVSCKLAPDETTKALTTHAIRAKVVDVDLAL